MRFHLILLSGLLLQPALVAAQGAAVPPAAVAEQTDAKDEEESSGEDWRSTASYPFPALARTVADMQNLAYAMTLRDYCSDRRVPDDFVRERLARFSQITGRTEDCQSLLDY